MIGEFTRNERQDKHVQFQSNLQSWIIEGHSVALRNNMKLGVNVQVRYRNMNFKKTEDTVLV